MIKFRILRGYRVIAEGTWSGIGDVEKTHYRLVPPIDPGIGSAPEKYEEAFCNAVEREMTKITIENRTYNIEYSET